MQSSPPQRATERAPSPTPSQYSIDLAALELDSHSGASTPLPTLHVEQILSEEIDGPSDFTLNMEAWMKGGSLRGKGAMASLEEKPEEFDEDEVPHTPEKKDFRPFTHDEDLDVMNHDAQIESALRESIPDTPRAGEKDDGQENLPVSSAHSAQVPHIEEQKTSLQPTVEEYYSELTPAPKHLPEHDDVVEPNSPTNSSSSSQPEDIRISSPTLSPARSPLLRHSTPRLASSTRLTLENQLEQLRTKCQHLEEMNITLTRTISAERRAREEENKSHETKLADATSRAQNRTEPQLSTQQQQHREEIDRLTQNHTTAVQTLKDELDHVRIELSEELRAAEQDVELARRDRDEAEKAAEQLQAELDEKTDECNGLRMEIERGEELRESIKEQLRVAKMELELEKLRARDEGEEKGSDGEEHRKEVEENVDSEAAEPLSPEDDDGDKHEAASDDKKELKQLRAQLQDLQQQLEATKATAAANVTSARAQIAKKSSSFQAKLNSALISRDRAEDRLATAEKAFDRERAALTAERDGLINSAQERAKVAELVEQAQAERIAAGIRKREVYWRGRVRGLEEERRKMAKALLRAWGREEVGVGFDAVGKGFGKGGEEDAESAWQWFEYLFEAKDVKGDRNGEVDGGVEEKCVRWS